METRRFVEFVVSSKVLTGAELLHRLGPADAPVETFGDAVGRPGAVRVLEWSSWVVSSGLEETASVEAHLSALHGRVRAVVDGVVASGEAPTVEGMLRIVQYLPSSEPQGHGFTIGPEWIEILGELNGALDVDQYVVADGDL